jgi:hypothetical protein
VSLIVVTSLLPDDWQPMNRHRLTVTLHVTKHGGVAVILTLAMELGDGIEQRWGATVTHARATTALRPLLLRRDLSVGGGNREAERLGVTSHPSEWGRTIPSD